MPCHECEPLNTHRFRSPDDLVHAFQVAAGELDRGVLERVEIRELTAAERGALYSAIDASALPSQAAYRFRCAVCGDRFLLSADLERGTGGWLRETTDGDRIPGS